MGKFIEWSCFNGVMLRAHWKEGQKHKLAKMLGIDQGTLREYAEKLAIDDRRVSWTPEIKKYVESVYLMHTSEEILELLNEKFPNPSGRWKIASLHTYMLRWGFKRDAQTKSNFKSIALQNSWNSGKRKRTFTNKMEVGATTIRRTKERPPYMLILTETGWRRYSLVLWERHNGPKPANKNISFKDGNTLNVVIENLYLTDRHEHGLSAQKKMSDGYIIGLLYKGATKAQRKADGELLKALKPEVIEMFREALILKRKTTPQNGKLRQLDSDSQNDEGALL